MFKLDDNLLQELGLGGLPPHEKNRMLNHIYESLEMRVGMRLADGMSEQQLSEFEQLMPQPGDTKEVEDQKQKAALSWLEQNFPNYKQVVAEELQRLKEEVKAVAPQIIASIQQVPPQSPPQPPQPPQMPQQQPPQQPMAGPQAPTSY